MFVIPLTLVVCFAVAADLGTPTLRPGRPFVHTNWVGASGGALAGVLLLGCLFPFAVALDPVYFLVQAVLMAGIVGAAVDLPMMLYRNVHEKVPHSRTAKEGVVLVAIAGVLGAAWAAFLRYYQPAQLPF